ncbi:Probable transposable element [Penicillium roqueforti FM164]|uniref:Probable transposable element n=1 Tax=Penicillium roqueforti (strain FM164) TaxID=1365484 RepID=W6PVU2_PENRF|nr:Probable transposable element [Penicillium roqueforti FM164]
MNTKPTYNFTLATQVRIPGLCNIVYIAMLKSDLWVISMDYTYNTNGYGLPLLAIVGFAATGSTFHIGFAFMKNEKQDTYELILDRLAEAYESLGLKYPPTILTNKEEALMKAIEAIFPDTKNMICIWHINICLLSYLYHQGKRPRCPSHFTGSLSQPQARTTTEHSFKVSRAKIQNT